VSAWAAPFDSDTNARNPKENSSMSTKTEVKKPKVGAEVKVKASRGPVRKGRFVSVDDRGPGQGGGIFWNINLAEKGKPSEIKPFRPGAVTVV